MLTGKELALAKVSLEKEEMRLIVAIQVSRGNIAIGDASPEKLDEVLAANAREQAVDTMNNMSRQLAEVREALVRIRTKVYGVCPRCKEDLTPKRLAAVPWAAYCVDCQGAIHHQETAEHAVAVRRAEVKKACSVPHLPAPALHEQQRIARAGDNTVFDRITAARHFRGSGFPSQNYVSNVPK